jgi:membrane-associated phospholipid phosphatase
MPSLHFATSVTAAHVLAETGRIAGIMGWTYALTLGTALVYLGEHYVVDLLAGLALAEGIRAGAPAVAPLAARVSAAVQVLEARART